MAECVLSLIVAETVQRSTNQEKQGYDTGYRFVEQMSERRLGTDPLEVMKFLCKELWFDTVWKSTSVSGAPDNSSLSHLSAMARPSWLGRAVRNRHRHAIEQAARRWRGGRRDDSARTRRKFDFHTDEDHRRREERRREAVHLPCGFALLRLRDRVLQGYGPQPRQQAVQERQATRQVFKFVICLEKPHGRVPPSQASDGVGRAFP